MSSFNVEHWTENLTKMAHSTLEMGTKSFGIWQEQTNKIVNYPAATTGCIQDTIRSTCDDLVKSANQVRQRQTEAWQSGLNMLSTIFRTEKSESPRSKKEKK